MSYSKLRILVLIPIFLGLFIVSPLPKVQASAPRTEYVQLWCDSYIEDLKEWTAYQPSYDFNWLDEDNATYMSDHNEYGSYRTTGNFTFEDLSYSEATTNITAIQCIGLWFTSANQLIMGPCFDNGNGSWSLGGEWYTTEAYSTAYRGLTPNYLLSHIILTTVSQVNNAKMCIRDYVTGAGGWPSSIASCFLNITLSTTDSINVYARDGISGENLTMPFLLDGIGNFTPYSANPEVVNHTFNFPSSYNFNGSHTYTFQNRTSGNGTFFTSPDFSLSFEDPGEYIIYYGISRNFDPGGWVNFFIGMIGLALMFFSWIIGYGMWNDGDHAKAIGTWLAMFTIGIGLFTVLLGG